MKRQTIENVRKVAEDNERGNNEAVRIIRYRNLREYVKKLFIPINLKNVLVSTIDFLIHK